MSSLIVTAFGYGLGVSAGRAIFGDGQSRGRAAAREPVAPVRAQTEEEILADEKRFDEDERRLDEADAKVAGEKGEGDKESKE